MTKNRDDFEKNVIDALQKRAAYICSNPECRKNTIAPSMADDLKYICVGEAAHITAASEGGPRYDQNMTSEDRKAIDNGIFLCSNCAKMIDKNNGMDFSVQKLKSWKSIHESWISSNLNKKGQQQAQLTPSVNVFSTNQSGGITAGIINIGVQPRRFHDGTKEVIVKELKKHPIAAYRLHYSSSDPETLNLANEIDGILKIVKWQKINPITQLAGPSLPQGITIFMLKEAEPMVTLLNQLFTALGNRGVEGKVLQDVDNIFKVGGWEPIELAAGINGIVIYIGPNN